MIISKCCKAETKANGLKDSGETIVICLKCGKECHYYENQDDLEQS
ncbi:MAG: hypothetical protein KAQ99_08670 [Candidatus Aureabacteria bacterium]|nr:hypothetical protein [Candidatus Auribacterota bacterium]